MKRPLTRRIARRALLTGLACTLTAGAASAPVSATKVAGGTTTLTLDRGLATALKQSGVTVGADEPASLSGRRLRLDVSGGDITLRNARGKLTHGGTLFFLTSRRRALLRGLTVTSTSLSADIGDSEGLPLARLDRGPARTVVGAGGGSVSSSGLVATLTAEGAGELNRILGVRAFRAGARLGLLRIEAERALRVTGGSATLIVAGPFNESLAASKFLLTAAAPATGGNLTSFAFPVTSGSVGAVSLDGQLKLAGGVVVDNEGPFITLRDPIVTTAGSRSLLTIVAGPFGRAAVADIDLTKAKIDRALRADGKGTITLTGVPVRFSPLAATALTLVGIPTLKGQLLGSSDVTLRVG